jgi:hypothetical protein
MAVLCAALHVRVPRTMIKDKTLNLENINELNECKRKI